MLPPNKSAAHSAISRSSCPTDRATRRRNPFIAFAMTFFKFELRRISMPHPTEVQHRFFRHA
jgi:hypothetical protein